MAALATNQYRNVCGVQDQSAETGGTGPVWMSPVDIYETENEITIDAQLPGIKREDLQIQVENSLLTLKGSRQPETEVSGKILKAERSYGSFNRSFKIPSNVDQGGIKSELSQGILKIRLPKREEEKPRQIEIKIN